MLRRRAFCGSGAGTREWGEARMALEIDLRCCVRVRLSDRIPAGVEGSLGHHTLSSATKTCIIRPPFGTTVA